MGVTEIEAAIRQLPAEGVSELVLWLEEYSNDLWDKRIAADLDSGRLDGVLAEVDEEIEAGLVTPL